MQKPIDIEAVNAVIASLRVEGVSITETMKMVRQQFGVDLGIAKDLVSSHRAWHDVVRANASLHDEAERILKDDTI